MCTALGITSHSERSPSFLGGTRRIATVTMSAPDRRRQSAVSSRSRYLPVPTIRRLASETGPSCSGESVKLMVCPSSAADQRDHLDGVAVLDRARRALGAGHDLAVHLYPH